MILDILPVQKVYMDETIEQNETVNTQDETTWSIQILPKEEAKNTHENIKNISDTELGAIKEYQERLEKWEGIQQIPCCNVTPFSNLTPVSVFYIFLAALIIFTTIDYFQLRSKKAEHPLRTALLEALIACIIVIIFCIILACCYMFVFNILS